MPNSHAQSVNHYPRMHLLCDESMPTLTQRYALCSCRANHNHYSWSSLSEYTTVAVNAGAVNTPIVITAMHEAVGVAQLSLLQGKRCAKVFAFGAIERGTALWFSYLLDFTTNGSKCLLALLEIFFWGVNLYVIRLLL